MMKKNVEKGKATAEDHKNTMERLSITTSLSELAGADFIVEAATERVDLKQTIFKDLSAVIPKDVILATNTSSISITKIGAVTDRPDKVIGMHFVRPIIFWPACVSFTS
jgi:3-hydroxybutyryl-CoA dehydrogenase